MGKPDLLFNGFAAKNSNRLVIPIVVNLESPGEKLWVRCTLPHLALIPKQNHVFENVVGSTRVRVLRNDGRETDQCNATRVTSDAFKFSGCRYFRDAPSSPPMENPERRQLL